MVSEGLGLGYRATVVCMGSNRQSISTTEIQVAHVDQQHTSVHKATEKRVFFWQQGLIENLFLVISDTAVQTFLDSFGYTSEDVGLWVFFHVVVVLASLRERHNGTVDEPKAKVLRDHHNGLSMDSGISV